MTAVGLFRESKKHDDARTYRLLDGLEAAYAARTGDPVDGGDLTPFEEVVLEGAAPLPGETYPPAGHTFPRRG
ncbi:hypothetical protein QMK19_39535 [Streptomyces sp. H10-C2]|uniref:hypothetical protein n=1 Tax=unclassified Streptomyces TaxID=2593676 RepID=UPI0024BB186D|nr:MULTISPECIES: hypothetical protein [unclassified Streptomyces]MDJ0347285.1 hypothetical protein [Streptomyces sp. PH10-H1]MDJ0375519.1 hypothetical protein [Streptomyces sp. H10-C2]